MMFTQSDSEKFGPWHYSSILAKDPEGVSFQHSRPPVYWTDCLEGEIEMEELIYGFAAGSFAFYLVFFAQA